MMCSIYYESVFEGLESEEDCCVGFPSRLDYTSRSGRQKADCGFRSQQTEGPKWSYSTCMHTNHIMLYAVLTSNPASDSRQGRDAIDGSVDRQGDYIYVYSKEE